MNLLESSIPGVMWAAATDRGRIRERNEDSAAVVPWPENDKVLIVLADGMGGHEGGHVASRIVVERFSGMVRASLPHDPAERFEALLACFYDAERDLRKQGGIYFSLRAMGATAIAAIVEPTSLLFLYAGDCRLYHFHDGDAPFVTTDHSVVATLIACHQIKAEDAHSHPLRSAVTSSISASPGNQLHVDPQWDDAAGGGVAFRTLYPGDRLVFSTDGLHGEVEPGLVEALASDKSRGCAELALAFVEAALAAGGNDNASVIVVDIDHPSTA